MNFKKKRFFDDALDDGSNTLKLTTFRLAERKRSISFLEQLTVKSVKNTIIPSDLVKRSFADAQDGG
jgi:hypothetical protein